MGPIGVLPTPMTLANLLQNPQYLIGLAGLATGGLAGALLTYLVSRYRSQTDLSLKAISEYLSMGSDIGDAKGLLADNTSLNNDEKNDVERIGGWFNIVSLLYKKRYVNRRIIRSTELKKDIEEFYRYTENASTKIHELNNMLRSWKYMDKVRKMRG
jgi:hypothetical protein